MISNHNSGLFHKVDLSLLKYFFDVASFGGFSKASRATGVSQPALSLGLQKLEKTLKVQLVRRGGGQFSLTDEGRDLLQFCARFESGLKSVVDSFGMESTQARTLRIGTALSVGFGPLVSLCSKAGKSKRLISVELTTQNTYDLIRALGDSQLDAALLPIDIYDSGLNFTPVHQDHVTFVVSSKFGSSVSGADWANKVSKLSLITYPRETPMRSIVDKLIQEKQFRFERTISVNSTEALKMLVGRNVGGAFVLRSLVLDELKSGLLVEPKQNMTRMKSGVTLATRADERGEDIKKLILELMGNA
jgi:DNA-binding transcriptional LysR family regulator